MVNALFAFIFFVLSEMELSNFMVKILFCYI
jgi:hypothetical protein